MADKAEVLLFEGIHRGGHSVFGKHCKRKKRVRSASTGKMIWRCAEFSGSGGGLGSLGALPFDLEALKGTLLTGAVAVGGAVLAAKAGGWIGPMLKLDPALPSSGKWMMVIEVVIGLLAGYAVGKYAKKPDLGAAVALGPVIVNGLKVVGLFLQPSASSAIAGHYAGGPNVRAASPLGAVIPAGQFPEWMYQSDYMRNVNQQVPAWSMGA